MPEVRHGAGDAPDRAGHHPAAGGLAADPGDPGRARPEAPHAVTSSASRCSASSGRCRSDTAEDRPPPRRPLPDRRSRGSRLGGAVSSPGTRRPARHRPTVRAGPGRVVPSGKRAGLDRAGPTWCNGGHDRATPAPRPDRRVPRHGAARPAGRRRRRLGRPAGQAGRLDRDHRRLGPGRDPGDLRQRAAQRRPPQPGCDVGPGQPRRVPPGPRRALLGRPAGRGLRRGPGALLRLRRRLRGLRAGPRHRRARGHGRRQTRRPCGWRGRGLRDLPGVR